MAMQGSRETCKMVQETSSRKRKLDALQLSKLHLVGSHLLQTRTLSHQQEVYNIQLLTQSYSPIVMQ